MLITEARAAIESGEVLTESQRLTLLNRLYDLSLVTSLECAKEKNAKFSAIAAAQMRDARLEINEIIGPRKQNVVVVKFDLGLDEDDGDAAES